MRKICNERKKQWHWQSKQLSDALLCCLSKQFGLPLRAWLQYRVALAEHPGVPLQASCPEFQTLVVARDNRISLQERVSEAREDLWTPMSQYGTAQGNAKISGHLQEVRKKHGFYIFCARGKGMDIRTLPHRTSVTTGQMLRKWDKLAFQTSSRELCCA